MEYVREICLLHMMKLIQCIYPDLVFFMLNYFRQIVNVGHYFCNNPFEIAYKFVSIAWNNPHNAFQWEHLIYVFYIGIVHDVHKQ